MIQSLSNARGCGATTFATPRVNIHDGQSSSTMSVPLLLVNVQHITNTRALSNRRCVIPQSEKSYATTSITVYYLQTLSRRGCPHLVVRYPSIQVIRYATSTFDWLELYHVSRSLWQENSSSVKLPSWTATVSESASRGRQLSIVSERKTRIATILCGLDAVYGVTTGACMSRDCSSESA